MRPAIKLLIRKAGARSSDMADALAKHVGLQGDITYSTNNGLIEVVPLGISKATGVEEVARPYEITAEDVVAFGDMPNDVPLLRWAGLGVAMGNAHPEAVEAADEVTAPNTDDGVARVLERWWLLGQLGSMGLIRSSCTGGPSIDGGGNSTGTPSITLVTVPFSRSKFSVPCWKFCTIHCGS